MEMSDPVSHPGRFTAWEEAQNTLRRGGQVGPKDCLNTLKSKQNMFLVLVIEPRFTGRPACSVVPFRMSFPTQSGTVSHCFLNTHFDVI